MNLDAGKSNESPTTSIFDVGADTEVTNAIAEVIYRHLWNCECEEKFPDGAGLEAWSEHVASVLEASFVLVPKDQLHQETAEQACSASGDLREQTKPLGSSASGPLDLIAQAILVRFNEMWPDGGSYVDLSAACELAQAAVDAMQLHQEWTWSWDSGYPPPHEKGYGYSVETREEAVVEADSYMTIVSRLVGSWRPADSKEQA